MPALIISAAYPILLLLPGYSEDVPTLVNDALFACDSKEVVLVRGIDIFSMCEHHMLPFFGRVHIAYIPNGKVLGEREGVLNSRCIYGGGAGRYPLVIPHLLPPPAGNTYPNVLPSPGLSKLARLADMFARRLQIQERLTRQIAEAVQEAVGSSGVAVMAECV